jgi:hypothetical protein
MRHSGGGSRPGRPTTAPVDGIPTSTLRSDRPCPARSDHCSARRRHLSGMDTLRYCRSPPDARPLTHPGDTSPAALTPGDSTRTPRPCTSGTPARRHRSMRYSRRRDVARQPGVRLGPQGIPTDQLHNATQHYGDCRSCQRLPELNRTCATPPGHDRLARRPPARRSPSRSPPPWRGAPGCRDAGSPFPRQNHLLPPRPRNTSRA